MWRMVFSRLGISIKLIYSEFYSKFYVYDNGKFILFYFFNFFSQNSNALSIIFFPFHYNRMKMHTHSVYYTHTNKLVYLWLRLIGRKADRRFFIEHKCTSCLTVTVLQLVHCSYNILKVYGTASTFENYHALCTVDVCVDQSALISVYTVVHCSTL